MMPTGSGDARANSLAELGSVIQTLICAPEVGEWIEGAQLEKLDSWQQANLREIKKVYLENTAIPVELNQRLTIANMKSQAAWRELRAKNNWRDLVPLMKESLGLQREALGVLSQQFGLSIYDTALSLYSPGLNTETVERLFGDLNQFLPSLVSQVVEKQKLKPVEIPQGRFPMAAQKALGLELMQLLGYDLNRGRLDESHHPFCGGSTNDVRITTRYNESDFVSALMGVLHETGHAIYEQNRPQEWIEQPVGGACGMAIHESQSLLMEMQVSRSREFLEFAAPVIRKHLAKSVENPTSLEADNLARLVSQVEPGLIRVDADEMTYPAHVILRFEIERALLDGSLPLEDLPAVWNEKMKRSLGLSTLGNDKDGCMQDVHWPAGLWGYFPAYTFGAVIAAQLFAAARAKHPTIGQNIARGDFNLLQGWLRQTVWSKGSFLPTLELVEQASGTLSTAAFKAHIQKRYVE